MIYLLHWLKPSISIIIPFRFMVIEPIPNPNPSAHRARFVGPGRWADIVGHATGGVFGAVDDHHLQRTWGNGGVTTH